MMASLSGCYGGSLGSWIGSAQGGTQQDQCRLSSNPGSSPRNGLPSWMCAGSTRSLGGDSVRSASSRAGSWSREERSASRSGITASPGTINPGPGEYDVSGHRQALSPRSSSFGRARRRSELNLRDRSRESDTPGPQSYERDKIDAAWQRLSTTKGLGSSHRMSQAPRTPLLQHNGLLSRDISDSVDTPGPGHYDTSHYKRALTPRGACRFPQSLRLTPNWVGSGSAVERETSERRRGRLNNREREYGLRAHSTDVEKSGLPGPLVTQSPPPPPKAMYRRTKGSESDTVFPNRHSTSEKPSDDVGTQFVRSLRVGLHSASGSARPARGNTPRGARQRPQSTPPEKPWRTPAARA